MSAVTVNSPQSLTLVECVDRVVARNETVQLRALEYLAQRKRWRAARGVFEPELVGSVEHIETERPNNVQQQAGLFGLSFLDEVNNLYSGGLEFLVPVGGRFRLGYSLRDLSNNLQARYGTGAREFETFTGLSLVQPLLKNAGMAVTLAGVRLAAGESELAFEEYRRQLMLLIGRTEAAYWDLSLAQEQRRIRDDSVRIAQTLLRDNQVRLQTGKSSELEVLQAEAGVALRQARRNEAEQKLVEAQNRLLALISGSEAFRQPRVRASDRPVVRPITVPYFDGMQEALAHNPDYRAQLRQVVQENIRVAYARNQKWPQLDLKASYGLNGLGADAGDSLDRALTSEYEAWSLGVELRVPVTGGIRGRNELGAAKVRRQQALLGLKSVEIELSTALDAALQRLDSTGQSVTNYSQVVNFNRELLTNELARLEAGKTDSRKVLEVEESLSEAQQIAFENLVNFQKVWIEWEYVRGATLRLRNLETTQADLEDKSRDLFQRHQWSPGDYRDWRQRARSEYETGVKQLATHRSDGGAVSTRP